jgi:hypothetical protein
MADVSTALGKIRYGGIAANQAAALRLARTAVFTSVNGARMTDSNVNRLVVVLTNNPSSNSTATLDEAAALRQAGVGVVTIGIGSNLNRYELTAAASYSPQNYSYTVQYSRNLDDTLADKIKRIICSGETNFKTFVGHNIVSLAFDIAFRC